jgi:hypothetical protein
VKLMARGPSEPRRVADARFLLARALWDTGRDRPRAQKLVAQANEVFSTDKSIDRDHNQGAIDERKQISDWLASHR